MKNLDKSKAYSFKSFNEEQLKDLALWFIQNKHENQAFETINEMIDWFNTWKDSCLFHFYTDSDNDLIWGFESSKLNKQTINALELFEDDDSIYEEMLETQKECFKNTFGVDFGKGKDSEVSLNGFKPDIKYQYKFQHIEYNPSNNTIDLVFYKKKDNGLIKIKRVTYMYVDDKDVQYQYDNYMEDVKKSVKEFLNK